MYVYKQTERNPALYTVGYYLPDGTFEPESDHSDEGEAAARVRFLNGGEVAASPDPSRLQIAAMAMQGLLAAYTGDLEFPRVEIMAEASLGFADALITAAKK